ncbi:transcription elongation regulator 1-like protein [Megalops cyprinoides]|uniref:transcription elongation regulator 1-like protein n=1 Tax=Megalops cyprinoides TaxID=118141 RepID=UPI00186461AA|nr:transcription elongation regulator 1-like protein [Megalops cyprinoides]
MIPPPSGLRLMGATPPPFLVSSHPPPVLLAASGWQLTCEPCLPIIRIPFKPEPAVCQWELPSQVSDRTLQPSGGLDLVPVFPHAFSSLLPAPFRKAWVEKRIPDYQIYLNNTLALDSAWIGPEEMGIFQWHGKPLLMTNQVAVNILRPTAACRNMHALCASPQRIAGCPVAIKRVGSNKRIALAATAMIGVETEASYGPPPSSTRPLHLLALSPVKTPTRPPPGSGSRSRQAVPVTARQVATVTSLCPPAMTFMATDWIGQTAPDKSLEMKRASRAGTLNRGDQKPNSAGQKKGKDRPVDISMEVEGIQKEERPVASTPVPGSPWCVVWTGDDRVFFFNPTMQLSVWEKPVDLKGRGDLNRIIEDPPHKRKKEASTKEGSQSTSTDDESEGHSAKTKRNKMEDSVREKEEEELCAKISAQHTTPPLEVRVSHFRDMLLERGVSAFSTWEKELHKIVFDPRYLLLNSEERKQIFDQFVKMRVKEEYKEKKNKLQQAKEEFRKLLEESRITSRSTFKEFCERYGRDQRFRQVQKKKDQEHFFNQFISSLKKRDKENRLRLRRMR